MSYNRYWLRDDLSLGTTNTIIDFISNYLIEWMNFRLAPPLGGIWMSLILWRKKIISNFEFQNVLSDLLTLIGAFLPKNYIFLKNWIKIFTKIDVKICREKKKSNFLVKKHRFTNPFTWFSLHRDFAISKCPKQNTKYQFSGAKIVQHFNNSITKQQKSFKSQGK